MRASHLFNELVFTKSAKEINAAAMTKATQIKAKIAERATRLAKLRDEYGIDDAALVVLLTAARKAEAADTYNYTSNSSVPASKGGMQERTIGAGAVTFL